MEIEKNKALVRRYFENTPHCPEFYTEIFAPRFTFHTIQHAGVTPQVAESTLESERASYESLKTI